MAERGKRGTEDYGYDSDFPKRLRILMENKNDISPLKRTVTQAELARYLGITRQAVSSYTLGTSVPDVLKFQAIADFFRVSYAFLLGATNLLNDDHNNFAEETGLGTKALNSISEICIMPHQKFAFICLLDTPEFRQILNAIGAFLSICWSKDVDQEQLLDLDSKVKRMTGGALRVIPAETEKDMIIMNAQNYLLEAMRRIDKETAPPEEKRNGKMF